MPTALLILGVLVVVFALAALATRDSAAMAPAEPDRADVVLPAGRVAPDDVLAVRFGLALRGYRMSEVDLVLERLVEELRDRDAEIARLSGAHGAGASAARGAEPREQVEPLDRAESLDRAEPREQVEPLDRAEPVGAGEPARLDADPADVAPRSA